MLKVRFMNQKCYDKEVLQLHNIKLVIFFSIIMHPSFPVWIILGQCNSFAGYDVIQSDTDHPTHSPPPTSSNQHKQACIWTLLAAGLHTLTCLVSFLVTDGLCVLYC